MRLKRMPGKRWKGGPEGWLSDMARCIENIQQSYTRIKSLPENPPRMLSRNLGLAENRFDLGSFEWWQGHQQVAKELYAEAAELTRTHLGNWLSTLPKEHYNSYARPAQIGAMAASLSGQPELARTLFSHAELLCTCLLTEDSTPPVDYRNALEWPDAQRPYIRVYCLLRLGRLSGFNGFVYTVPLDQARKAQPVWRSIDIHQALDTANLCFELWRPERGGLDSLKQKKFEPLLRALAACLSPGAGEPERLAARRALQAYEDAINDLHFFQEMYPRVLDLRAAYPDLFPEPG